MRKHLLHLLLLPLLLLASSVGFGATMTNRVFDAFGNPYPVRVTVIPFTPTTVFGGTNVIGPSVSFDNNKTTGDWSVNLMGGFYLVQQGLSQPQIAIWANPGDPGTNSFAYYAILATNPIPTFFAFGSGGGGSISISNLFPGTIVYNSISNLLQSLPNGKGALTNNGLGVMDWYPAYLANTNDNGTNMNFYATTSFIGTSTNGNTYWYDWTGTNVTAVYNGTNFYGSAYGLTNLVYRYTTNSITNLIMTFGKSYKTNLSTSITITAINAQDIGAYETVALSCTNPTASDVTVTLPNMIVAAGGGS